MQEVVDQTSPTEALRRCMSLQLASPNNEAAVPDIELKPLSKHGSSHFNGTAQFGGGALLALASGETPNENDARRYFDLALSAGGSL